MYNQLLAYLRHWSEMTDERRQLQHVYAVGGVLLLVVAGLVGLVNDDLGQTLASIALVGIGIFFANGILWALIAGFVFLRLAPQQPQASKPRTKKK